MSCDFTSSAMPIPHIRLIPKKTLCIKGRDQAYVPISTNLNYCSTTPIAVLHTELRLHKVSPNS